MENNRRRNKRATVTLETVIESSSGKRETRISDLSVGGCFVDSIVSPVKDETVVLNVQIPPGDWLKLSGEVVYVYPGIGFGVSFSNVSEEEKALLELLILARGSP